MLQGTPDAAATQDEAAAAWGLVLERPAAEPEPAVEIWAEHWPAVRLFGAMQTQWRHSPASRSGLDYSALPVVEKRLGLSGRRARTAFDHLRVMEAEALLFFSEQE